VTAAVPDPITRIERQRVLPILRGRDPARLAEVVDAVVSGGLGVVELTMTSPEPLADLAAARRRHQEAVVGMGTVTDSASVATLAEAGAAFIVTPVAALDVVTEARRLGLPVIAGALTPTEVFDAHRAGASAVKIFPAGRLGAAYLSDVRSVMPDVRLVPTGGITEDDVADYLDHGAAAVGLGSSLTGAELRGGGDLEALRKRCAELAARWSASR
jgi:2-dehydro-3-deoxyphosphogluconate aldolase / (4S)-4-hydroxy-2-oxoglutarate aldolase